MKPKNNSGREYLKWSSIAMQGVVAIVALLFLGRYIDRQAELSSTPIFTIAGVLLGVSYFFYSLFRAVVKK